MYDEQRIRLLPTPSLYCVSLVGRLIYCFASNFGMICISILINIVWRICIHILSQQFYCPCVFSPFLDTHTNSWRIIDDTKLSGVLMGSREWVEGMKVARCLPWIVDCFFLNINRRWRRSSGSGLRWKRNSSPGKPVSCIINHLLLLLLGSSGDSSESRCRLSCAGKGNWIGNTETECTPCFLPSRICWQN